MPHLVKHRSRNRQYPVRPLAWSGWYDVYPRRTASPRCDPESLELPKASETQSADAAFLANMLRVSSRAFAAHASELLLDRNPDTAARWGDRGFAQWQESLAHRVQELAAAIESGQPGVFAADVRWSRAAFLARGVAVEDLTSSIAALRDACMADIPPAQAAKLDAYFDAADAALSGPADDLGSTLNPSNPNHAIALAYLDAATSGDQRAAIATLTEAQDKGTPLEQLFCDVLLPAQFEIGTLWHLGQMSVVGEHVATEITRSAISILSSRAEHAPPRNEVVLVGAVANDRHDIAVRATSDLMLVRGYRSICLGSDVPAADFATAARDFKADAIVMAAAMSLHLPAVKATLAEVAKVDPPPHVIVGGNAFGKTPELATQLGAAGYAASPVEAVNLVVAHMGAAKPTS